MHNEDPHPHALLLRVEEVSRLLGLGTTKTRALLASGELRAVHGGRAVRVPRAAVVEFIERRLQAES